MNYKRTIQELESKATLWWSSQLNEANANISIIPKLLETQDDFLSIISLSKANPFKVFDLLEASEFPANLFLKTSISIGRLWRRANSTTWSLF